MATKCRDFNNSPNASDNTSGHSHMLREEQGQWNNMQSSLDWVDLWQMTHPHVPGFTFHHTTHSAYYARLDRWYLLHASQYENFTCTMHVDHALQLSDHAPVWLDLDFGNHSYEVHLQRKRFMLINNSYLKHELFKRMVYDIIPPLYVEVNIDVDIAWVHFVHRLQTIIQEYGKWYVSRQRDYTQQAKFTCQALTELAHRRSLTLHEEDALCMAKHTLMLHDKNKLEKWQVRSRQIPLKDKGCSSKSFFKRLHLIRQRESIKFIKTSDGFWTTNRLELAKECVTHFSHIFENNVIVTDAVEEARDTFLSLVQPTICVDKAIALDATFTMDELLEARKGLGKGKAPGWDGITLEFIAEFWDVLKDLILSMANNAWQQWDMPISWKEGLVKLIPKKKLCESFSDWRPITLMPVIYKLIAKIIANRIKDTLLGCIHVNQYGFIPRRQITDNIANDYIGMEYAKYTKQDVLLMQIDIEKAFDTIQWDFVAATMVKLRFGPKMSQVIYWLYGSSTSSCIIEGELTDSWSLAKSVRQGCPVSALLYAIATHPLLLYMDHLVSIGQLHGLQMKDGHDFVAQAYADDTSFLSQNNPNDMRVIMDALKLYGLAAGLQVNFKKSKLLPLTPYSWHQLLWPGQIVSPNEIVRHLGYPLGWNATGKRKAEWVLQKVRQKLSYWKIATWPLHVRLRIVQSIFMAYMQYYLIMIDWPKHMIQKINSEIISNFWCSKQSHRGIRLLSLEKICTPRLSGGLNFLNLHLHMLARKATLLPKFAEKTLPWARMLFDMFDHLTTKSFG